MYRPFLLAAALSLGTTVFAQGGALAHGGTVSLDSTVKVERTTTVAGRPQTVLEAPKNVVPGDKLVFATSYKNAGAAPATKFVVTNPVPGAVAWTGDSSNRVTVSVDGGRTFGPLGAAKVRGAQAQPRAAQPAEVTHLRWTLAAIAPGGSGQLLYRGIVR